MSEPIHRQIGNHRFLVVFAIMALYFIFPAEKPGPHAGEGVDWDLLWYNTCYYAFFFLGWVSLSDTLANLWRLAEFLLRKAPLWFYWPLIADLAMIGGLWLIHRANFVEKVIEEGADSAVLSWFPLLG